MAEGKLGPGWQRRPDEGLQDVHFFRPSLFRIIRGAWPGLWWPLLIATLMVFAPLLVMNSSSPLLMGAFVLLVLIGVANGHIPIRLDKDGAALCARRWSLHFAWSEIEWIEGLNNTLHVRLGPHWIALNPKIYPAGEVLMAAIRERSQRAISPPGSVSVPTWLNSQTKSVVSSQSLLQFANDKLTTENLTIHLDQPMESAKWVLFGSTLRLKQGSTVLEVGAGDPRCRFISEYPEVAAALSRQKPRRALR